MDLGIARDGVTAVDSLTPKRCSGCGAVVVCEGVTCPLCHRVRVRPLTPEEQRAWRRHEDLDEETRGRAVQMQVGMEA
jgi:hypothetical protein